MNAEWMPQIDSTLIINSRDMERYMAILDMREPCSGADCRVYAECQDESHTCGCDCMDVCDEEDPE